MSVCQSFIGVWPGSGEIDIVEARGNAPSYTYGGIDQIGSTLHFGPNYLYDAWSTTHQTYQLPPGQDFSQEFHVFGLYWNETIMFTYLDTPDNVVLKVDTTTSFWSRGSSSQGWSSMSFANPWVSGSVNAPFDQLYYIILNVAVGGWLCLRC